MIDDVDSGYYDPELDLYAHKILMQVSTNSIDWKAASIQDLIWIEVAFFMMKSVEDSKFYDMRFLLKDLADSKRIQLSHNTKSIIKPEDLPSYEIIENRKQPTERKLELIRTLAKQTVNKNVQLN